MMPSKRETEKAFRDAGLSARQAKAVISKGYIEGLRDDLTPEQIAAAEEYLAEPERDSIADLLIRAELLGSSH
jgi:hypothetical protein